MSDALSFAEFDGQHVELLPARTVLSMFSFGDGGTTVTNTCSAFEPTTSDLLGIIPASSGGGELCGSGSTVTN